MIHFRQKGDFSKTRKTLVKATTVFDEEFLDKYGEKGVAALKSATPKDTGLTSESWLYRIESGDDSTTLSFYNTNLPKGVSVALVLQNGHATVNGGWVEGIDYINPALEPIFEEILKKISKELS